MDKEIYGTGYNKNGELGINSTENINLFMQILVDK
jgi:hypothetical protein